MSMVKVEWSFYSSYYAKSGLEFLIEEPVPFFRYYQESKTATHRKCPAFTDYYKNVYVVCSPIDFEVEINKDGQWCDVHVPKDCPKELFNPRFNDAGESPYPIFSLVLNSIVLSSKDTDVFVEQLEPTMEWNRDPNIRVITGTFNIRRWVRPIEVGFEQKEKNVVVKFKRGQPMYYLRFTTGNTDDNVVLEKAELTKEKQRDIDNCIGVKLYANNKPLSYLYALRDKFMGVKK